MKTSSALSAPPFLLAAALSLFATFFAVAQAQDVPSSHLPIITAQPLSQTAKESTRVTFAVEARGPGTLAYRWYRNQHPLNVASSPTLTLESAKSEDGGSYRVEVSNAAGTVTSNPATLSISTPPPTIAAAPTITLHPTSLVVNSGSAAIFSVNASGAPILEYQWLKNEVPIGGATSPTLALTGVKAIDGGSYTVRVTNSSGTITSTPATLTVNVTVTLVY